MTAWIIGFAVFFALAIAYLGFEMWGALLVDDDGNVVPDDDTRHRRCFIHCACAS